MNERHPKLIGKADERNLILAYLITSQLLAEWRRVDILTGLDNNNLRDDANIINSTAANLLGIRVACPMSTEGIISEQEDAKDSATIRGAKLQFSMYEYCLTGETSGEAALFCKTIQEMQQIVAMINHSRAQQAQVEASTKVQVASTSIDLSAIKGGMKH